MTRKRAAELWPIIKAYGEGETVQAYGITGYKDVNDPIWSDGSSYRIKPEPKMRPMTRGEVLYMATTTPGMVVRGRGRGFHAKPATYFDYLEDIPDYEYAIIDASGEPIDGWHKFEKECEA